ncbi:MAG: hypothetical protein AB1899_00575 [Pseudomonadota bacterium]
MPAAAVRILLLSLALLFGQAAGFAHVLGEHAQDDGEPHAACEWCGIQASLGHGLAVLPPPFKAWPPTHAGYRTPPALRLTLSPPATRSRDPPALV